MKMLLLFSFMFFFKLIKKVFVFKGNACILLETVLCVFFPFFLLWISAGSVSWLESLY